MMKMTMNRMLTGALVIAAVLAFSAPASASYSFDGFEVNEMINGMTQGDVFVSYGDKAGLASAKTAPYRTNYSVPGGTAVSWARLYVGIWGGTELRTGWVNTTLNGTSLGNVTLGGNTDSNPTYSSGTNAYNTGHGVWMVSYNCTNNVTLGVTNQAVATVGGSVDGRVYGIVLVVAYENSSLPKVRYWVNEGNVNLNYVTPLNNTVSWFNGTAYNSTEAKFTVLYYTGSNGENDYLYLNAPYADDSPYNLSNISWNIDGYRRYQLDSNNVANGYSGAVSTSAFDLDSFTSANDATPLKDIINIAANNYAIFWRGHDDNGNGSIDSAWNASGIEGEAYVHPVLAVLRLSPYNVSIEANTTSQETTPGVNATYLLSITNYGGVTDNYTLTVTNTNDADVAALNTSTVTDLGAGDTAHVLLNVTDSVETDYSVTVTVTSDTDNRATDSVTTTTTVTGGGGP